MHVVIIVAKKSYKLRSKRPELRQKLNYQLIFFPALLKTYEYQAYSTNARTSDAI
jgi:hypothetical protein